MQSFFSHREKSGPSTKNPEIKKQSVKKQKAINAKIEKHKAALVAFKNLLEPGVDDTLRVLAANYAELAACYKEECDPKGMYYAYQAFDALRKITKKDNVDHFQLINVFNYYLEEFPTHRHDLPKKDYDAAIISADELLHNSYAEDLAIATAFKNIGIMYAKKEEKELALTYFLKATQQLSSAMNYVLEDDKKYLLRIIETHYRSIKAYFPCDSIEHKIFSYSTLVFSSYLRISEEQRATIYQSLFIPLLIEILKDEDYQLYQEIFLQQLEMLMMAYQKEFFLSSGPFVKQIMGGIILPNSDTAPRNYGAPIGGNIFLQEKIAELREKINLIKLTVDVDASCQASLCRPC